MPRRAFAALTLIASLTLGHGAVAETLEMTDAPQARDAVVARGMMAGGLAIHREPEHDELVVAETRDDVTQAPHRRRDRAADLAHHVLGGHGAARGT